MTNGDGIIDDALDPTMDTGKWRAMVLSTLIDCTMEVRELRRLYQIRQGWTAKAWAWVKNSLAHAAEEAKKIRLE